MNNIDISKIIEEIKNGNTLTNIAKTMNTTRQLLAKILLEHGYTKESIKQSTKPALNVQEIIQEIRNGKSLTELSKCFKIHRNSIAKYLLEHGHTKESVKFNHNFFETVDNEEKAYWLGFIMADGCVSKTHWAKMTIKLKLSDGYHLEKFHYIINSCLKVNFSKHGAVSTHYSEKMCEDLIKYGCVPKKSLILKFPENLPESLIHHFVRGYFDGDGCADLKNKKQKTPQLRVAFVGTKEFLDKIKEILNLHNKLYKTGTNKINYRLEISGNKKAKSIANWMYSQANIFLERKKEVCYSI